MAASGMDDRTVEWPAARAHRSSHIAERTAENIVWALQTGPAVLPPSTTFQRTGTTLFDPFERVPVQG